MPRGSAVSWTAGTEWTGERAESSFITGMQDQEIPVERTQLGVFGEGRFELGRLSIQGGARFEQVVRGALEGNTVGLQPAAGVRRGHGVRGQPARRP